MAEFGLIESLMLHVGKTVTIFTESGGLSGSGFTGVLAGVGDCGVRLITSLGAAPACPVGSSCTGGYEGAAGYGLGYGGYGYGYGGYGYGYGGYGYGTGATAFGGGLCGFGASGWLGSVTEIPLNKIVSFVHTAI
jgi:hypothetical protein